MHPSFNTLVIYDPIKPPIDPSPMITLDETSPTTHPITQAHGKTSSNEENPPNPIKCVPFSDPTPISTSRLDNLDNSDDDSWSPTLSNSPMYSPIHVYGFYVPNTPYH